MSSPVSPTIPHSKTPKSILIIGAGVFGLSTLQALLSSPKYAQTDITLVDPYLPLLDPPSATDPPPSNPQHEQHPPTQTQNPHAASIDSSRIIRADYANPAYARLALTAQQKWREGFGGEGVYRESGVILTASAAGSAYVSEAMKNAKELGCDVEALESTAQILKELGVPGQESERAGVGEQGYVNRSSGWADAAAAMQWVMDGVVALARARNSELKTHKNGSTGRVRFVRGTVSRLLFQHHASDAATTTPQHRPVLGAALSPPSSSSSATITADLTILAAGAWSGSLLDLTARVEATAQVLSYIPLHPDEAVSLAHLPVLLNLSSGMFVIPPTQSHASPPQQHQHHHLKIARHAYGYTNPVPTTPGPGPKLIHPSLPHPTFTPAPQEGLRACCAFLAHAVPALAARKPDSTRLCWYADTPRGDFLITYHPTHAGLFLATGGSGHGFKFLPVVGGKVLEGVEGRLGGGEAGLWGWGEGKQGFEGTEDGSRGGGRGMRFLEEWARGGRGADSRL